MKTKAQKKEQIELGAKHLDKNETVLFTEFTGLNANDLNTLRRTVKEIGGKMVVMKKRLLKLSLASKGIEFDPKQFEGQAGVIFSPKDIVETSGAVYKFGKPFIAKNIFKMLGGLKIGEKQFISREEVLMLGQLPPREVLLGQLVGMIAAPIRSFMFVLDQKSKQS